jgi:hypothetical protein
MTTGESASALPDLLRQSARHRTPRTHGFVGDVRET